MLHSASCCLNRSLRDHDRAAKLARRHFARSKTVQRIDHCSRHSPCRPPSVHNRLTESNRTSALHRQNSDSADTLDLAGGWIGGSVVSGSDGEHSPLTGTNHIELQRDARGCADLRDERFPVNRPTFDCYDAVPVLQAGRGSWPSCKQRIRGRR